MSLTHLVIRVPLRVSFCGGGTDLKDFYMTHGGAVVFTNIAKYVHITIVPREDEEIMLRDIDFGVEKTYSYNDIPHFDSVFDLAKATIQFLAIKRGMEITIKSDVAPGSGLGTSSAITIGLLKGLIEMFNLSIPNYSKHLAEMAYTVEREIMNCHGGIQDYYAAAFKGINILECTSKHINVRSLNMRESFMNDLQMHLMLCYSGESHYASNMTDEILNNKNHTDVLLRIKELVYDFQLAWEEENLQKIAYLMTRSMWLKQDLSETVVTPKIRHLYDEAMHEGALGGRLLGAGGGGYLLFLTPFKQQQKVKEVLRGLGGYPEPFIFDLEGIKIWKSRV